jgi:hypothetical protein
MLARVLWLQGFADQAIDQAQASLEKARASAHELSVLYPLAWAVYPISLMTGALDGAERALAMARHLATTQQPIRQLSGKSWRVAFGESC